MGGEADRHRRPRRRLGISKVIVINEDGEAAPLGKEVAWTGTHHWSVAAAGDLPWAKEAWRHFSQSHRYYDISRGSEQCFEWHWRQVVGRDDPEPDPLPPAEVMNSKTEADFEKFQEWLKQ